MVFPCKKRSAAEVFRPASIPKHQLAPNAQEPRPARTPPSTFLFLLLNLSNSPTHEASKSLSTSLDNNSAAETYRLLHHCRDVDFWSASNRPGRWPRRRRAQWPSYRRGLPDLSTRFVRKSSRSAEEIFQAKKRRFFRQNAASMPHCSGVLTRPSMKIPGSEPQRFSVPTWEKPTGGNCNDAPMAIAGPIAWKERP